LYEAEETTSRTSNVTEDEELIGSEGKSEAGTESEGRF
jgi:hypothetical protein